MTDAKGERIPLQAKALMKWSDGSIKWALLDFWATVAPNASSIYELKSASNDNDTVVGDPCEIVWNKDTVCLNTGAAVFHIDSHVFKPFDRVIVKGVDVVEKTGCDLLLVDDKQSPFQAVINDLAVEVTGPVRTTLRASGTFGLKKPLTEFISRISFYKWKSLIELQLTIRNSRAAKHRGGLWDLGDEGSVYFRELTLQTTLANLGKTTIEWSPSSNIAPKKSAASRLEIYQDSSGGQSWRSTNHINRFGQIPTTFKGYRVSIDGRAAENGERCVPLVRINDAHRSLSGTIPEFWQNFPKAITAHDRTLKFGFFPSQFRDVYELQGGEQKTHKLFLSFEAPGRSSADLAWVHSRLVPIASAEWYHDTHSIRYFVPRLREPAHPKISELNRLIDSAISGNDTFFSRREIIDEYGWRNFGDLFADHEAVGFTGNTPRVAHYNNQYDVVYGAVMQYLRSGDVRWFKLLDELARHVIDIDIYHTKKDRAAYNGGMFWHTAHYSDAATATHRTYSRTQKSGDADSHGGGPSSSHNYTTGLLYYYLLTGETAAYEVVEGLADWVLNMDDGGQSRFGAFDKRPTGLASRSVSWDYHGPGRGSGNSLNALLDAWLLTGKKVYRSKMEELIQRCIHPNDDISARGFEDIENRWSYLIFLQSLGKYLDIKAEAGDLDYFFQYARDSLLHYARWMCVHEVPYRRVLHKVEIPTETWPAQDIRKTNVFHFAAKYAPPGERFEFSRKAEEFFVACVDDLLSFSTARLTRPLVLLITNAFVHPYCLVHVEEVGPDQEQSFDFGHPREFRPQLWELYQVKLLAMSLLRAAWKGWHRPRICGAAQHLR
jgi:hypothetical protein